MNQLLKLSFSCLFILLIVFSGQAQLIGNPKVNPPKYQITGQILDEQNHPIPGVHVILSSIPEIISNNQGQISDIQGKFEFSRPTGKYRITTRLLGYSDYLVDVKIEKAPVQLEIRLSPKDELLDDVVISASKGINRRQEVVVSMEIIKPDLLAISAPNSLEDAVKVTPGLNVADGQASIRSGAGYSYGAGSRVLLLYNGLPMLSADAGDIKWNIIPLNNIERLEVIKGASSSLYGSGALNGVINVITNWPGSTPKTQVSAQVGVYDSPSREELNWYKDSLRYLETFTFSHCRQVGRTDISVGAEQVYNTRYRTYTYEKRQNAHFKVRYRPEKYPGLNVGIGGIFSYQDASNFFLWQNSGEGAYLQDSSLANPVQSFRIVLDPFINYSVNDWNHSFKARYFYNNSNNTDDTKDNSFHTIYSEYLLNHTFNRGFKLIGGVNASASEATSNLFENHTSSGVAFFLQAEKSILEKLRIVAGLRLEGFTLDTETEFSNPLLRLGFNYELNKGGNFRISFGQAFRYPTIAEKFTYTQVGALQILPNPWLESETGYNAELGYRQEFKYKSLKAYADLAIFQTIYNNMMEFTFGVVDSVTFLPIYDMTQFGTNPVGFQSRNIGQATIPGIEISTGLQFLLANWECQAMMGYTYTYPMDRNTDSLYNAWKSEDSELLKYRFLHAFNGAVTTKFRRLSISYALQYNSKIQVIDKFFELGIILPGLKEYREEFDHGVLNQDVSIGYQLTKRLEAVFTVRNLANREQMIRPGDLAAPRMFLLQLNSEF
ncbi:MAG: TonB-dependent receptor [Bacteroidales bacterium]|nr:TonB-dependent receptor [Bacteroidales bacterium]